MKNSIPVFAIFVALVGFCILASPPLPDSTEPLQLRNMDHFVKITDQPFAMHDSTLAFCRPPEEISRNPHEPAHLETAFCNVYVNDIAKDTMLSGIGIYPEGSIVIKSKLATFDAVKPELFTVMRKMESGYDSERGNWEYSVVDGSSYRQIASGRIDSCIDCHEQYRETDYVTREYVGDRRRKSRSAGVAKSGKAELETRSSPPYELNTLHGLVK